MNIRPLILRELRAESRRPNSYWVRTLAAASFTVLFAWSTFTFRGRPSTLGPILFLIFSFAFILAIQVVISALTADTISREKREGTLGLLFLTPLTAREIVVGKTVLQLLRAIPVILAVVPTVGLPLLLGGVAPIQLVVLAFATLHMVLLAVAAGMLSSVRHTAWIQSIVLAQLLGFFWCLPIVSVAAHSTLRGGRYLGLILLIWAVLVFSMFLAAVLLSAYLLKHSWQSENTVALDPRWVRFFSNSDFWRTAFRWNTAKARDKNPIAWLQEYNWTARLTKWGWAILLFAAQIRMLFEARRYLDYQLQLYALVAFGIAFSAAASFRAERQTGALELLLVTPISAAQIIWGRLQGIWFHFLPPVAILATVWIMGPQWISLPHRYLFYLAGAYFCIPPIGFYISLLTANVLVSWLVTLFFSMLIPYAVVNAFHFSRSEKPAVFFCVQAFLALGAFYLLHENLARRRFALSA